MSLSNKDIEARVTILVAAYLDGVKFREARLPVPCPDEPVIKAGLELISNLLCDINDIAESLGQLEAQRRGR